MTFNAELARSVLEHIRQYPETHSQETWTYGGEFNVAAGNGDRPPCGTTMCFAGWAAFLAAPAGVRLQGAGVYDHRGRWIEGVDTCAARHLGLDGSQADALFMDARDLDDLTVMVGALTENPGVHGYELRDAARTGRV